MSICTADNQKQQIGCSYYEKSQFAERCMYYIFEEYCDSLTAQMDAQELRNWALRVFKIIDLLRDIGCFW